MSRLLQTSNIFPISIWWNHSSTKSHPKVSTMDIMLYHLLQISFYQSVPFNIIKLLSMILYATSKIFPMAGWVGAVGHQHKLVQSWVPKNGGCTTILYNPVWYESNIPNYIDGLDERIIYGLQHIVTPSWMYRFSSTDHDVYLNVSFHGYWCFWWISIMMASFYGDNLYDGIYSSLFFFHIIFRTIFTGNQRDLPIQSGEFPPVDSPNPLTQRPKFVYRTPRRPRRAVPSGWRRSHVRFSKSLCEWFAIWF